MPFCSPGEERMRHAEDMTARFDKPHGGLNFRHDKFNSWPSAADYSYS